MARTFFEYYKATGVIAPVVLSAAPPRPGDDNDKKTIRGKGRPKTRSRAGKGKSRDKSRTRSPSSNPKDISGPITTNTNVNDNDHGDTSGEMDKTVVKLSQLTREAQHNSADSSDLDSSEDEVKVRATRNGAIFQQQYIRRRSSSTANPNLQPPSNTHTNGSNVSNNHNAGTSHNNGKVIQPAPVPGQRVLNFSGNPQRPTHDAEVKKTAYQTFDFSILKEHRHHRDGDDDDTHTHQPNTPRRVRRFTHKRSDGRENARKIGGGGIVGKRKARHRESHRDGGGGRQGITSETETEAPCLTIIDFNLLIRKALEGRGQHGHSPRDGGWRGWSSGHRLRERGECGHVTDGGISTAGRRRRNNVRRRRAILLRGTVTDCSPWEEDDQDGQHSSSSDSQRDRDTDFLPFSSSSSHMTKGNLRRHELNLNPSFTPTKEKSRRRGGGGRREKSPATPTLSPSPIFLPQ